MAGKIEVRRSDVTHQYRTLDGPEVVWAYEPTTAQELLMALLDQATKPCNRWSCQANRSAARTAEDLNRKLAEVIAERDALERLLTRKVGY